MLGCLNAPWSGAPCQGFTSAPAPDAWHGRPPRRFEPSMWRATCPAQGLPEKRLFTGTGSCTDSVPPRDAAEAGTGLGDAARQPAQAPDGQSGTGRLCRRSRSCCRSGARRTGGVPASFLVLSCPTSRACSLRSGRPVACSGFPSCLPAVPCLMLSAGNAVNASCRIPRHSFGDAPVHHATAMWHR